MAHQTVFYPPSAAAFRLRIWYLVTTMPFIRIDSVQNSSSTARTVAIGRSIRHHRDRELHIFAVSPHDLHGLVETRDPTLATASSATHSEPQGGKPITWLAAVSPVPSLLIPTDSSIY